MVVMSVLFMSMVIMGVFTVVMMVAVIMFVTEIILEFLTRRSMIMVMIFMRVNVAVMRVFVMMVFILFNAQNGDACVCACNAALHALLKCISDTGYPQ